MSFWTSDELEGFSTDQRAKLRRFWLRNYVENFDTMKKSFKDITDMPDLGFGRPAVVLGGAPIQPEAYEVLKSMDCITTVCCDKALPAVLPHFRPNFVVALNTQKTEHVELEKWFADSERMTLVVPVTVHPDTVKLWKGDVLWMNPTNIDDDLCLRVEQETGIPRFHRGDNAGEFAVTIASFLRPAEIALFGMWYAWKTREEVIEKGAFGKPTDMDNYDVVEVVEAGERWWSNLTWLTSRTMLMQYLKGIRIQGIETFNCSEGGVVYHPNFCRHMKPEKFRQRWADIPPRQGRMPLIRGEPDDKYAGD